MPRRQDIRALFPPEYNPFYAGFGNRDTDEISYLTVGIPAAKIFIINPKGAPGCSHVKFRVMGEEVTAQHQRPISSTALRHWWKSSDMQVHEG